MLPALNPRTRTIVSDRLRTIVLFTVDDGEAMRIRWLGWAGVEIEAQDERVLVDPLQDAAAVFGWLRERGRAIPLPEVVAARPGAVAGLLTHLHRDHADAGALRTALRVDATVYEPVDCGLAPGRERLRSRPGRPASARLPGLASLASRGATASPQAGRSRSRRFPPSTGPEIHKVLADRGRRQTGAAPRRHRCAPACGGGGLPTDTGRPCRAGPHQRRPARRSRTAGRPARCRVRLRPSRAALAADLLQADRLVPIHYGGYDLPGV